MESTVQKTQITTKYFKYRPTKEIVKVKVFISRIKRRGRGEAEAESSRPKRG